MNINAFKHYENLVTVDNEIKQHVKKKQLFTLIYDFEQAFPMGTAIK